VPAITPFRALSYAPGLRADFDRLIAPPYDVVSPARREALAAGHPRSIVHLDLPCPGPEGDVYAASAARLSEFIRERTLVRDELPAFYILEQLYRDPSGEERTRRGFFARLRLEPFDAGVVLPHERTMERPRTDRRRLLAATRTHLSAVFLLHPDRDAGVARLLERIATGRPWAEARDADGVTNRVVRLGEGAETAFLVERLSTSWALIADGHHRYESALAYRDERRAAGRADAESVLAFFCSLEDRGLSIFPIHRLVRSLGSFDRAAFLVRLSDLFTLVPVATIQALRAALGERRGRPGVFGMALSGEPGFLLLEWRAGAGLDRAEIVSIPEPLRSLDVILLHRLVLEGILGITAEAQARQTHLDYVKDDGEVFERVHRGEDQIGFLLNPTRIDQVVDVTRRGLRLPQKTTYFYPKVPTGFVLDPLDS
jgi:uncharacterized protein (DUF1015 family)